MARVKTITTAFNGGEITQLLDGRVDQDKYFTGCKQLRNFIPTVQGPARRRGGTRFVGLTADQDVRSWGIDFVYSADQSYILEFGHLTLRFWVDRGQLLDGPDPYEVVTPYTEDDLITVDGTCALRTAQLGDIMWIVHAEGKHPPYRLSRLGAIDWTLVAEDIKGGPFRDINQDDTIQVTADDVEGTVTVTAIGAGIFTADHVGMLFFMETADPSVVTPYQPTQSIATGAEQRNAGNVYEALIGCTYDKDSEYPPQRYPPVHTEGDAWDGAALWKYLHSGYGWGRITAVTDSTHATMEVIARLPTEVTEANPSGNHPGTNEYTRRWAWQDLSAVYGWPTNVCFFRGRLVYARGTTVYMSTVGGYDDFAAKDAGLVTKETAIKLTLDMDKLDSIRWMTQSRDLLLGSPRAEFSIQEQTTQTVFAADNIKIVPQTEWGGRMMSPLRVGSSVLFVERAGHRVRDTQYSFEIDRYKAEELTVLAEHLFDGSEQAGDEDQEQREIVDWAYQQQRDSMVWAVRSDGALVGLVLNRERGVIAWAPQPLGGPTTGAVVEWAKSIPSPDGKTDDLWMQVRRTVDGETQRTIEFMEDYRLVKLGTGEAFHVDSGVTYRGTATDTIDGLEHLEGETVSVCADGSKHPDCVVTDGEITLDRTAELVHVGYAYASRMQLMRMEVPGGGGSSQTAKKGIATLWLRLQSTIGGKVGPSFDEDDMDDVATLDPYATVGTPPELFTGDYKLEFPGGFEEAGYICYEQSDPLPATLVAIIARVTVND